MPTIPYNFDETEDKYMGHLDFQKEAGLTTVRWKYIDLPICHPSVQFYPSLNSIAENTPAFTDHRKYGFSLGLYSEFFVAESWGVKTKYVNFFLGNVEVSLGDSTPLVQYIYDGEEIRHYHPPVTELKSIRLIGSNAESVEATLLYSVVKLKKKYNMRFDLFSYHEDFVGTEEDDTEEAQSEVITDIERFRPTIAETTPLRLFIQGVSEPETSNAFLQFFRVLEYFSLVPYESNIEQLRRTHNLNTRDFVAKLQAVISKDEKGLIFTLAGKLADTALIKKAQHHGLIAQASPAAFCTALYEFRNSLVHAKSDHPSSIYTESIFQKDESAMKWKEICEELALRAMEEFGMRA